MFRILLYIVCTLSQTLTSKLVISNIGIMPSLRTLSLLAIMKTNISIPTHEIPLMLYTEIQSIRRLVEVRKEKDMILDKERRIESQLSIENFECDLFFNMFTDSYSCDEDWNYYLWQKFDYHGSKVCLFEEEEDMIKEKKKKMMKKK